MPRSKPEKIATTSIRVFLVPCSCGATFVVSENYDRQGTAWTRYLKCPNCGKRHDPKNRAYKFAILPPRLTVRQLRLLRRPILLCLRRSFFFKEAATTEIYTLSLHDALPI